MLAAAVVPVTASAARGVLALLAGDEALVPAYAVRLCRRALCDEASPTTPGMLELAVVDAAVVAAWLVAAACLGAALWSHRPGWVTLPLAVVHGVLTVVLWNPIAFAAADGAWWGQLLALAAFVGVVLVVRLVARGAAARAAT